jgi:hypothetical protein
MTKSAAVKPRDRGDTLRLEAVGGLVPETRNVLNVSENTEEVLPPEKGQKHLRHAMRKG